MDVRGSVDKTIVQAVEYTTGIVRGAVAPLHVGQRTLTDVCTAVYSLSSVLVV
jgi:hypothetical protein